MMKKITRIAALLAATALLFGAIGCSGGDDGGSSGGGEGEVDPPPETVTPSDIYAWTFADLKDVTIEGVVNATKNGWPTTGAALAATTVNATTFATTADGHNGYKDSEKDIIQFALKSDVSYPSTGKEGLTMKLKSAVADVPVTYNAWSDKAPSSGNSAITSTASAGYIEGEREFLEIAEVQGPFKVEVIYCANSSSDKTDRYAFVKIGSEVTKDSAYSASIPAAGSTLTAVYNGTDKVTVAIGGRKNDTDGGLVRIHDVKITPITTVVAVDSVSINSADSVTELTTGEKTTLTATVSPNNATNKTVTWSVTGEDGTTTTTAATVTDGEVTANTVTADTVVKVFAKAGEKTSAAYSITIKPKQVVAGEATVTYFADSANASAYSAAGKSSDASVVTAKDIIIEWGSAAASQFSASNTNIYTTNSIKGYGIQSDKITLTENANGTKADFVSADGEIVTVKVTLTPVKNFTVQKISGQFVNGKSGNTLLYVNGTNTGVSANKTLDLADYKPTDIKGMAGTDLEIVFAIKASDKGVVNVTAANFQWTQVMNDIEIVVVAD